MTGFGDARHQGDTLTLGIEVRALNNRHLKVTVRGSEPYPMLESELEKVVRKHVRRGTILIHVRAERQRRSHEFRIDPVALRTYLDQVRRVCNDANSPELLPAMLGQVLALPGVAVEPSGMDRSTDEEWPIVERTLEAALKKLDLMRIEEGRAMADELVLHRDHVANQLDEIRKLLPGVTKAYRERLHDRIRQGLSETGVIVDPDHFIREVAIFAEKSDIAEEVMRLGSHLDQFVDIIRKETDGPGRKLEFVAQEMSREVNTIGSKASDVAISRHVVEIKATLEKVRELLQNVE